MTQISTQQLSAESKRAKKRAEKASRSISESNNGQTYSSSPDFDRDGSLLGFEERKHPFLEVINKRIRALQKKKVRIDQYQGLDVSSLNKDQLSLLEHKDQILVPLKELQELLKLVEISDKEEQEFYAKKIRQIHSDYDEKLQEAKKEGFQEGIAQVASLVRFLRHASWLRASPSGNAAEDAAVERVLTIVYEGGETAVNHVNNLATGKDEPIEGIEGDVKVTWTRMKQMVEEKSAIYAQQTLLQEAQHGESLTFGNGSKDERDSHSHRRPLQGEISFLNESEIDVHPPQEPLTQPLTSTQTAAVEFPQDQPPSMDHTVNVTTTVPAQEIKGPNGNKSDDDGFITRQARRQSRSGFEPRGERGGFRGDFRGRGRGEGRGRGMRTRGEGFKRGHMTGDRGRGRGGFKKNDTATPIPAQ